MNEISRKDAKDALEALKTFAEAVAKRNHVVSVQAAKESLEKDRQITEQMLRRQATL